MNLFARLLMAVVIGMLFNACDSNLSLGRCVGGQCAAQRQFRGDWIRSRSVTRQRTVAAAPRRILGRLCR
jgi:hypothetical protein